MAESGFNGGLESHCSRNGKEWQIGMPTVLNMRGKHVKPAFFYLKQFLAAPSLQHWDRFAKKAKHVVALRANTNSIAETFFAVVQRTRPDLEAPIFPNLREAFCTIAAEAQGDITATLAFLPRSLSLIRIKYAGDGDSSSLAYIPGRLPLLKDLELLGTTNLKGLALNVPQMLSRLVHLRRVHLDWMDIHLASLAALRHHSDLQSFTLGPVLGTTTYKLQSLGWAAEASTTDFINLKKLVLPLILDLGAIRLLNHIRSHNSLRHLFIASNNAPLLPEAIKEIARHHELEVLAFTLAVASAHGATLQPLGSCVNVKRLQLRIPRGGSVNDDDMRHIIRCMPKLKTLVLMLLDEEGCSWITPHLVVDVLQYCPELETLEIFMDATSAQIPSSLLTPHEHLTRVGINPSSPIDVVFPVADFLSQLTDNPIDLVGMSDKGLTGTLWSDVQDLLPKIQQTRLHERRRAATLSLSDRGGSQKRDSPQTFSFCDGE